jgi:hypothetical protein
MIADLMGNFAAVLGFMALIGGGLFVVVLGVGSVLRWW